MKVEVIKSIISYHTVYIWCILGEIYILKWVKYQYESEKGLFMNQETYNNFTLRLKEERLRVGLSQSEIAQKLKMSQSHYSRVELVKRRLSFYETKWLCKTDVDVFFVFTGQRVERISGDFFEKCEYNELLCYLDLICMLIMQFASESISNLSSGDKRLVQYVRHALLIEQEEKNIFKRYRDYSVYNQAELAKKLGVDIKKFRDLERGKLLPDSELIWRISTRFNIPFSLILKDSSGLISEICYLMGQLIPDRRTWLLDMMQKYHDEIHKSRAGSIEKSTDNSCIC